ncbi:MAG: ketopantoate reductase family protein [Candidatus Thorarchaeota archaeon]|jgi:2-dehydropantoate 2-reductase
MASYLKPGEVEYTWKGNCIIGEMNGVITDRIKQFSKYMSSAIQTDSSVDIEGDMWTKLILNLINIPLALTGISFPFGFKDKYVRLITEAAWSEGYDVVKAAGIKANFQEIDTWIGLLKDKSKLNAWLSQLSSNIRVHPSTHQSLVRGSTDESDYLTGELVRLGDRIGMKTPVSIALMQELRHIMQGDSMEYMQPENLWQIIEDTLSV